MLGWHTAELRQLVASALVDQLLGAANQEVDRDTGASRLAHGVLRWLRLHLANRGRHR